MYAGHVESWRKGRLDVPGALDPGQSKQDRPIAQSIFQQWVNEKGLKPSETRYVRAGREGTVDLRFSQGGDPEIEKTFRTHFVSPALSGRKLEKLEEKLSEPPRPVVFEILRDSECTECGVELPSGSMLFLEAEQALCLACAGMGELEFLPAGDMALTRRATKYSGKIGHGGAFQPIARALRAARHSGGDARLSRRPRPSARWMRTTGRRRGRAPPGFVSSRTRNWWSR